MGLKADYEEFKKKSVPGVDRKEVRSADELRMDKARWELTIGFLKKDWVHVLRALRYLEE